MAPRLTAEQLLGQRIFEDTTLSEPSGQSCASCHDEKLAFTGNNGSSIDAVARGSRTNTFGNRNSPSAMYASFSPAFAFVSEKDEHGVAQTVPRGGQFWDGRAASLREQAKGPFLNTREMNNPNKASLVAKIAGGAYASLFREVYGADTFANVDLAYDRIADAVAAFEQSARFHPFSSKFDRFLKGETKLSAIEARGFALFKDAQKGNCLSCHAGDTRSHDPAAWLFTDFSYDALGVPRNPAIEDNANPAHFDLGLCAQPGLSPPADFALSSACGAFKVPTLRNIAKTEPYMHNGVFKNLRDVVSFYATRDTNPERWYPSNAAGETEKFNDLPAKFRANVNTKEVPYDRKPGQKPRLSDEEIDALVAFLKTLSDAP